MTPEQLAEQYAADEYGNYHPNDSAVVRAGAKDWLAGFRAAGQVDARHPPVVAAARELARTMDEEVPWRQWPQPVLAAWEALRAALEAQPLEPRKLTDEQESRLRELALDYRTRLFPQAEWKALRAYVESLLEGQSIAAPAALRDARRYRMLRKHTAPFELCGHLGVESTDIPSSESTLDRIDKLIDAAIARGQP